MITSILILIPFISALATWFITRLISSYFFNQYLPAHKEKLLLPLATTISESVPEKNIAQLLDTENLTSQSMPFIEEKVDDFLNVKLQQEIPMLSMFAGNKLISQIREIFIKEIKSLLPKVIDNVSANINIKQKIYTETRKLLLHPVFTQQLKQQTAPALNKIYSFSLLVGFITGLINSLLFWYMISHYFN